MSGQGEPKFIPWRDISRRHWSDPEKLPHLVRATARAEIRRESAKLLRGAALGLAAALVVLAAVVWAL